jgi:VWFA-related protein
MRTSHPTALAAAALILLAGGGLPAASTQSGTQAPAPPVHEAELVAIDFLAVGPDGRPVKDLTPGQVTLRIDGRDRVIHGLQYVELGAADIATDRSGAIPRALPAPFGSNLLADAGRLVMIVVNHESISPGRERPARDGAIRFLRSLSPRDRVGLITLPRGATLVEPTRDHETIRTALLRITGQAPQTTSPALQATVGIPGQSSTQVATSERACMTRLTLESLAGLLQSLDPPDEPKTIVFISSGLSTPTRDAPTTRGPGQCEVKSEHFEHVAQAAHATRAHFYLIQPHELIIDSARDVMQDVTASRFSSSDDALAGLQNLAGVTGGEIFRLTTAAPEPVFHRVATETSGYYVIDFRPEPDERNGLSHRVEVRVAAPDVAVRHHPQIMLARVEARKDPKFLTPHDMLRGVRRFRTLPLRAIAYPLQGPEGLGVLAVAEPMDPSVRLSSAAMGLVDGRNRLVRQWTANKGDLDNASLLANFPVAPGNYRLLVAAIDTNGRHGTVEYSFTADLTPAGPAQVERDRAGRLGCRRVRAADDLRRRARGRRVRRDVRTDAGAGRQDRTR